MSSQCMLAVLTEQIEVLRQELQNLVEDDREKLRTDEAYALSVKLDKLIGKFNNYVHRNASE